MQAFKKPGESLPLASKASLSNAMVEPKLGQEAEVPPMITTAVYVCTGGGFLGLNGHDAW